MSREELIKSLTLLKEQARNSGANTFVWDVKIDSFNFVIDMAIKALEQEPTSEWEHDHEILKAYSDGANEVIDKIRAEIEEKADGSVGEIADGLYDALEIIDKYKAETEPQTGSNECMFSDYPDMPYQYDNMTGSMNL